MLRSVLAVVAGAIALFALTALCDLVYVHVNPHAISAHGGVVGAAAVVVFTYVQLVNVAGGFVTGWVAKKKPAQHAAWLGLLTMIGMVLTAKMLWHEAAHWYLIASVVAAVPLTTLGGGLAKR